MCVFQNNFKIKTLTFCNKIKKGGWLYGIFIKTPINNIILLDTRQIKTREIRVIQNSNPIPDLPHRTGVYDLGPTLRWDKGLV